MAYRKTERIEASLAGMRQGILNAACKLIESGELEAREVADIVGCAVGTIYTHWPDMRELAAAAIACRLDADLHLMTRVADQAKQPIGALAAAIAVYIHRGRKWPGLASITTDAAYRQGIVRALETYLTKAHLPAWPAIAVYGALNAVLTSKAERPLGNKTESALVLMALRMVGVSKDIVAHVAAGCALAKVSLS